MITMAAHLEGKACSSVDQFGMAQKGGAVTSHLRLAARAEDIKAVRLNEGAADLLLGCDGLVAGSDLALDTIAKGHTRAIVNRHEAITGHFTRDPDTVFPSRGIAARLEAAAGRGQVDLLDATRIATGLMGDSIATNLFMLGYAWQKGLVPVSATGIERAIELNGVAVESNQETFRWGRRAAVDLAAVTALVAPESATPAPGSPADGVEALTERRAADLVRYQDRAYAERYRALVADAQRAETRGAAGKQGFAQAVARYAYKLMAYKDEYEVARLFADGAFAAELERHFEGDVRLEFHMAPPVFAARDPDTGAPAKAELWSLDDAGVAGAREAEGTARHPLRPLRPQRGAPVRTAPGGRVRGGGARARQGSRLREPRPRGGHRFVAGRHPGLRPREGGAPRLRAGAPGGATHGVAHPGRSSSRGLNWAVLTHTTPGLPLPPLPEPAAGESSG